MKIEEFLISKYVKIPRNCDAEILKFKVEQKIDTNKDLFIGYIKNVLDKYKEEILLLDDEYIKTSIKEIESKVEILNKAIIESLEAYYKGFPAEAYKILESALDSIYQHLTSLQNCELAEVNNLYRVRIGKNQYFEKKDMFHIPFDKRHLVGSQRYSISGLPTLYLGTSVFVCWEEMGRPDLNDLNIVRIKKQDDKELRVLDLGYRPINIYHMVINRKFNEEFVKNYIVTWPLIFACSLVVENRTNNFKKEYIIPQLLLQWIRKEDKFDGIRYFSVSSRYSNEKLCIGEVSSDISLLRNYVFPVKTIKEKGFCNKLLECFIMTDPASWQAIKTHDIDVVAQPDGWPDRFKKIEIINGKLINYADCDFWNVEKFLWSMDFGNII